MKTIFTLILASVISVNAMADLKSHPDKYCAKMKDGKKVVMHEGNAITAEVVLSNGTKIETDGTVIKKDGTKTMLNEGQCISKEGVIAAEEEKKK